MKQYRKRGVQLMEPWSEGMYMQGVSVSQVDRDNGSPKEGDMIAVNSKDQSDRWLVARGFFEENYEEVK